MKSKLTILLILIISFSGFSQQGINYKALIKDSNGNVAANQGIDMVFSIQFEDVSLYSELQQIVTDSNGIAIATIGIGSVITGVFETIDWKLRNTELNVKIDFGDGLVDFGNSPFNAVPYAIETLNKDGLTAINEGSGSGWRLAGVITDGEEGYGDIGLNATDLSVSDANGASLIYPYGATGIGSFATGSNTIAFGDHTTALGFGTLASGARAFASGRETQASGSNATAMGVFANASGEVSGATGASVQATGNYSTAMGRGTNASGSNSTAIGRGTSAVSLYSTAIGRYNFGYGDPITWNDNDPLFQIGNGLSNTNRSNALTVFKSGSQLLSSDNYGMRIYTGNTGGDFGIEIVESGGDGLIISSAGTNGIRISNAGNDGISTTASNFGARFTGTNAGLYASAGFNQNDNPDIILGSLGIEGDDGIISTNPLRPGSDMFLRSYDAVVIQLDYDNNESGNFRIRNGADAIVFDVNESGNATLSGSLSQNSDRRLKKDIENLDYGLKEILELQPKQYFWKSKEQNKKSLGLIAQDVQTIIGEIVTSQDDELNTLGISYTELIPVLINAIKEQNKIINSQGEALKSSDMNYKALLSRIEQLETKTSN
jgi:hypothetical protein